MMTFAVLEWAVVDLKTAEVVWVDRVSSCTSSLLMKVTALHEVEDGLASALGRALKPPPPPAPAREPSWQRILDPAPFERCREEFLARVTSGVADPVERDLRQFYVDRWAADLEWRDVPEAHQAPVEACYQRWRGSDGAGEAPSPDPNAP
jgi:hypothetical protein